MGIKVGGHLKYELDENPIDNQYLITFDDKELNIPVEMANNIFIRI